VKEIILLGGPDGAGRSTAAKVLLPQYLDLFTFLNADETTRQIAPADPESVALTAGRRLIERMRTLVSEGRSFALETTCSGKSYLRLLEQCKRDKWRITLLFFWLPSPEAAVERVARRVSLGGHGIPVDVIHRRYRAGVWNMRNLYLPLANEAEIYDNSLSPRVLIAEKRSGQALRVCDFGRWRKIEEMTL
jgi:predicted ABC-type ATPase